MSLVQGYKLTDSQAADLARYFLGPDWSAERTGRQHYLFAKSAGLIANVAARSWDQAFVAAGVTLPYRSRPRIAYAADHLRVRFGEKAVCTAVSNTMAKRIALALNLARNNGVET